MRLGATVFVSADDPDAWVEEHRRLGYRAAFCPPLGLDDAEKIRAVRDACARADLVIGEVGAWRNLMDPDESKRRANLAYVSDRLALADEVGALCCVDLAGSFNPTSWWGPHPDDLSPAGVDLTIQNVRAILDTVHPRRARFALEMMPWTPPDSAELYRSLLAAVDRPAFAVHIDPVNLINSPRAFFQNGALIHDCFEKLGPWIVSCHAKDTVLQTVMTVHIDEVRPGLGALDYRTFLRELARLPAQTPLLIEHLRTTEECCLAADYIRYVAAEVGVAFA